MGSIVFVAAPYGYGPTSKILCIAEELVDRHETMYVGMEPGISLANKFTFSRVVRISDRDHWNTEALRVLRHCDLLVSAMEYRALPLAAKLGRRSVFVDTLLWLREAPPPHVQLTQKYIAQRFLHQASQATDGFTERLVEVGPILPSRLDAPSRARTERGHPRVLVCVGGLRSPAMAPRADLEYIHLVVALLEEALPPFARVHVALPKYLRPASLKVLERPGYTVTYPSTVQFYEMLDTSDLLITTPGLEVVYEAIAAGVPLVFLPPYNGTQLLQADSYSALGIALYSVEPTWKRSAGAEFTAPASSRLNSITRYVQAQNARLGQDHAELRFLARELREQVGRALSSQEALAQNVRSARRLLRKLGRNGRQLAASTIELALTAVTDR